MAQHYTGAPDWVQCGEKSGFMGLSIEIRRIRQEHAHVSLLCFMILKFAVE